MTTATMMEPLPKVSLYQYAQEIVELEDLRQQADEEGDTAAVAAIDQQIKAYLTEHLARKASGIRGYIREQMARAAVHKAEAARYSALAARETATVERLKAFALGVMQMLGVKRLDGPTGDRMLSRRGNGGVMPLVIAQPAMVPPQFQTVTVTMTALEWARIADDVNWFAVDKPAPWNEQIRAALELGLGVPGCHLAETRGEHLEVT